MHLHCVFLDQEVKIVISNRNRDAKHMAAINQHAAVEKFK